jgi:hypothetical protein
MKKASIIILIVTIALVYFVREGKRATLNSDGTRDKSLSLTDYFFRGLGATFEEMSPKQTTSLMNISNFCFRTIVK